jgi:hypothetical protein
VASEILNIFSPGWVFTFVLEFHYYDRMSQKWRTKKAAMTTKGVVK